MYFCVLNESQINIIFDEHIRNCALHSLKHSSMHIIHCIIYTAPDKRATDAVRMVEVVSAELGWVPGVEVATMILVIVVQTIVELPTHTHKEREGEGEREKECLEFLCMFYTHVLCVCSDKTQGGF